jgi:hypothetical protein
MSVARPEGAGRTSHVKSKPDGRRGAARMSWTINEVNAETSGECAGQSLFEEWREFETQWRGQYAYLDASPNPSDMHD